MRGLLYVYLERDVDEYNCLLSSLKNANPTAGNQGLSEQKYPTEYYGSKSSTIRAALHGIIDCL